MDHTHHTSTTEPPFWKSKIGIALIMLAVIGIFYVAREHYGHLSQALPYLILLLCPLMHLFMHGGHGGHGGPEGHEGDRGKSESEKRSKGE